MGVDIVSARHGLAHLPNYNTCHVMSNPAIYFIVALCYKLVAVPTHAQNWSLDTMIINLEPHRSVYLPMIIIHFY